MTSNEETRDIPVYVKHHKPHIGTHYGFPFSATLASEDGSDILKMGCSWLESWRMDFHIVLYIRTPWKDESQ